MRCFSFWASIGMRLCIHKFNTSNISAFSQKSSHVVCISLFMVKSKPGFSLLNFSFLCDATCLIYCSFSSFAVIFCSISFTWLNWVSDSQRKVTQVLRKYLLDFMWHKTWDETPLALTVCLLNLAVFEWNLRRALMRRLAEVHVCLLSLIVPTA